MHKKTERGSAGRVLLADDDWSILRALKVRVEHAGFDVHTASDGINAVISALENAPDVAVLDINMPGMDGFGVAEKLVSARPECKIIFLTANRSDSVRKKAGDMGAVFIEKPFDSKLLTQKITQASESNVG